jgi:hypothetical protein
MNLYIKSILWFSKFIMNFQSVLIIDIGSINTKVAIISQKYPLAIIDTPIDLLLNKNVLI